MVPRRDIRRPDWSDIVSLHAGYEVDDDCFSTLVEHSFELELWNECLSAFFAFGRHIETRER